MMPGPPVTLGCSVVVSPGVTGAPDTGVITMIPPGGPLASGMPLAFAGSLCTMVNSVTGVPYPLVIGSLIPSMVKSAGQPLVRIGDAIPSAPGILTIIGPPASPAVVDSTG
jgi:hypothetical protein